MSEQPSTTRCLVIPANTAQPIHAANVDAAAVERIVNGQPGIVLLDGTPAFLYINEYGRITGAAPNPRATRLVDRYIPGYAKVGFIMGDAVLLGMDAEGMEAALPADIEASVLAGV